MTTHNPPIPEPQATALPRQASVPESRMARSLHLGRLAGELLAGAVATGAGQLARGERPSWAGALLTPGNAHRLTERLAHMRGAVMKVGQMLSMDGQGVLPAPFADLLARLRDHQTSCDAFRRHLPSRAGPRLRRRAPVRHGLPRDADRPRRPRTPTEGRSPCRYGLCPRRPLRQQT